MEPNDVGPFRRTLLPILRLGRFHFLFGGILLYVAGAELAVLDGARFSLPRAMIGYAILFGAHLSVSYSNDYFDMEADSYNQPTAFSGGSGILRKRPDLAKPSLVLALCLIGFSIISLCVFSILFGTDLYLIMLTIAGNFLGWSYTAPPLRLAYRGLGELSTAITVGSYSPRLDGFPVPEARAVA